MNTSHFALSLGFGGLILATQLGWAAPAPPHLPVIAWPVAFQTAR